MHDIEVTCYNVASWLLTKLRWLTNTDEGTERNVLGIYTLHHGYIIEYSRCNGGSITVETIGRLWLLNNVGTADIYCLAVQNITIIYGIEALISECKFQKISLCRLLMNLSGQACSSLNLSISKTIAVSLYPGEFGMNTFIPKPSCCKEWTFVTDRDQTTQKEQCRSHCPWTAIKGIRHCRLARCFL